ncbi:hypothetical protein O6H91_09G026300 [Diphasiastrum complanatum]|uniref:Uncharacterized protein n=3 Tax=Diphasiastrum complanatum TaxID=34168 RepID=A0ACC2CM98_DIPCM|nr:hypothetical protein O6H91_09G025500 [Diphasiastrum complanatum]KAJ7543135.1 hypothetical protein O6H91_09G026300 [Diphasiastrum complanatum]
MDSDVGKLFIGGISWETTEERLKEYFQAYGEVTEVVIMKDRATGRARGFGFVVFADPTVADRVLLEKHTIDGRTVEAKKAVPRDEQQNVGRNMTGGAMPTGHIRTKKIFVGGLASTVTEEDFKRYFEQFGAITDVVVMYDHTTQRPRGFGFITFDSEDAVENVLQKPFHELNEKLVEVKRAIPKELQVAAGMRSPAGGFSGAGPRGGAAYGYGQGYSAPAGAYDGRGGRGGYPSYSAGGYGATGYGASGGYGAGMNGSYGNAYVGGYGSGAGGGYGGGSYANAPAGGYGTGAAAYGTAGTGSAGYGSGQGRNAWGTGTGYSSVGSNAGYGSGASGYGGWTSGAGGTGPVTGTSAGYSAGGYGYSGTESGYGATTGSYGGRGNGYAGSTGGYAAGGMTGSGSYGSGYGDGYGSSGYTDSTWRSGGADPYGSAPGGTGTAAAGGYGSSAGGTDAPVAGAGGYGEGYGATGRQTQRGFYIRF